MKTVTYIIVETMLLTMLLINKCVYPRDSMRVNNVAITRPSNNHGNNTVHPILSTTSFKILIHLIPVINTSLEPTFNFDLVDNATTKQYLSDLILLHS